VPVNFADINHMSAIGEIEFEEGGLMPELSFGSHFFQDLVENNIFFLALFPTSFDDTYKNSTFDRFENCFHDVVTGMPHIGNAVKLYRFDEKPLILKSEIKSQILEVLIEE
jgi:hypothetical protein